MPTLAKAGLIFAGFLLFLFVLTRLGAFSGKRPENLGVREGRLAPCPDSPNCVSTQAEDTEHSIDPLHYSGGLDEARARLLSIIREMPRTRVIVEQPQYLHVEFRTAVMMFADDVEFYFEPAASGEGGVIHFRSASRLGYSDMGVNRRRMEEIRQAFAP